MRYDVKLQYGIATSLYGGEALFVVHMTRPDNVTLQISPISRMPGGSRGIRRRQGRDG